MDLPARSVGRMLPGAAEEWMTSLTAERIVSSANPENPSSVVSAIRFLLQMSIDLDQHGNYTESVSCSESALLLRQANDASVQPLLAPLISDGVIKCGQSIPEEAENLVLRCNGYAVRAFNEMQFDVAEFFLGKALFLTDMRSADELNFFSEAEARRRRLRAATLNNLGCMEKRRKRLEESLMYLRQAVELEVSVDTTSRGSPSTYLNLCTVLNELQRHHEAVNAAECAIASLEEQLPRQSARQLPACAMMLVVGLYNLGVSLECRSRPGDDVKARTSYQRALEASRRYFVDPNCPTVELAMAAIRRMHAAPAFRADQVETKKKTRRKHGGGPVESLPQPQEEQASAPAAAESSKRSESASVSDVHLILQPTTPVSEQQVQLPRLMSEEQQQPTRVTPLMPPMETAVSGEEQPQRVASHSLHSLSGPSASSTPFRSFAQSISEGASQLVPHRGSLTPLHPHPTSVSEQQHSTRSEPIIDVGSPTATRTSLQLPTVFNNERKQPAPRPAALAPIKRVPSMAAAPSDKPTEGPRRLSVVLPTVKSKTLQKPSESTGPLTPASASNPFGRRVFGSSAIGDPRGSGFSSASQRNISGAELMALEKHVQRTQSRQAKVEEEKKKKSSVPGRRGSALARAKEREMKRQAKEEERHDAEMAEELYTKFVTGMRAEKLARSNRASILIQRVWRGCLARTLLRRMIAAAKKIQRAFRAFLLRLLAARRAEEERLARLRAEQEKRELEAVLLLQARARQFLRRLHIWRAYLVRKMQRHCAALRIQRGYRAFVKWREEHIAALMRAQRLEDERQRQKEMNAARCIQCAYSRYLKRKKDQKAIEAHKRRERAAAKIQALLRGVLARAWFRYYKSYRREQELKSAANQKRIAVIQSAVRLLLSARLRRAKEMNLTQRFREYQLRRAATKIQCQWRNHVAWIKFERLRAEREMQHRHARRIQRWYATCVMRRKFLQIREMNRRNKMAKKIQSWFFKCKEQIKAREMARYYANLARQQRLAQIQSQAIVFLQAWGRGFISMLIVRSVRSSFLRLTLYAEEFQRIGRGYAGRRATHRRKCQIIYDAKMRVVHMQQTLAACVIQRAWRCAMAKNIVEHMRRRVAASTCISKHYRGYMCRKELQRLRMARSLEKATRAVVVMQRAARQFLQRLELVRLDKYYREKQRKRLILMRREEAATTLQAAWRGRATRMALERERKALEVLAQYVVKIQRVWRARRFRLNINATVMQRSTKRVSQTRAALTLQCFWRKMMAAERVARLRELRRIRCEKVVIIQCWWRQVLARRKLELCRARRKEELALQLHYMSTWEAMVTLINTVLRVHAAQKLLNTRRRTQLLALLTDRERERFLCQHTAATKIQAIYRGHYGRVYARGMRRQKEKEERLRQKREALEKRSAIIIQCAYRSWRAICEANARRAAKQGKALEEELEQCTTADPHDVVRQLFWTHEFSTKRDLVNKRLQDMDKHLKAASVIQRVVRQWISKKRLEELRRGTLETRAAKIIQSYWKNYCASEMQKELDRKCRAAVIIQARFRGNSVRREWRQWREQLAHERLHEVLKEDVYDRAATVLQSCWRRVTAKRLARRIQEQQYEDKGRQFLNEAARIIQRAYRRYKMFRAVRAL